MKKTVLWLALFANVIVSPFVSAVEPVDETRLELIRTHCIAAQATMQRVLRSDTVARINRGRSYEEMVKLLAAFNSRAALNTYDASTLVQATAQFESEFAAFKSTWLVYETTLRDGIRMNCRERPADYYDSLTQVRQRRAELTAHIDRMNQLLDTYDVGFDAIRLEIAAKEVPRD